MHLLLDYPSCAEMITTRNVDIPLIILHYNGNDILVIYNTVIMLEELDSEQCGFLGGSYQQGWTRD